MSVPPVLFGLLLSASPLQQAMLPQARPQQASAPNGSETPARPTANEAASDELPVSLKRIQRALAKPPSIRLLEPETRNGRQVYRVDVEGEKIDIQTIIGKDSLRGPSSYGAMTHQEFLNLVTPTEFRGFSGFSNAEGMVVAATSVALQWAVLKAIDKFKEARDDRAKEQARKEVQDAVDALRKARTAAGLPDK